MSAAPPFGSTGRRGRGSPMRRLPLRSVRNRLVLAFFVIAAAAVAFVYLYVVPQLDSSLTAEKLRRLEAVGLRQSGALTEAMERGASQDHLRGLVRRLGQDADARVTVLGVRPGSAGPRPEFVVADSEFERTAVLPGYLPAAAAAGSGRIASGVERVGGERVGETAIPIGGGEDRGWVAVLSTSLADVDDNVALIRRQILIAGAIAIAIAALGGWFAARAHSRRLRRLEGAAEQVAEGNFHVPIPVDSDDEVGQLAKTFDEMQTRLARLDSARKEFIANASHELRTPIFSLGGFVELLETEDPDPQARREFVRNMREQTDRLGRLATDLLDLSKLDAGVLELRETPVDLDRLAARLAEEFGPTAERRGSPIALVPGKGVIARGDPDRIGQIMRILIDNALRHTPEGTPIELNVASEHGSAAIAVRDRGPGIDPEVASRLFDRFYTGDSVGGTGLGLAIARELALRMSGTLTVASGTEGTEFKLALPIAAEARA